MSKACSTLLSSEFRNLYLQDTDVHDFYSLRCGWKMFDENHLTSSVRHYLRSESQALKLLINHKNVAQHLVEVGCGYGRYLNFSLELGLTYDGIDLVPWLPRLGTLRALQQGLINDGQNFCLHSGSVLELEKFLRLADIRRNQRRSLIFFPFNCFGNLAHLPETLAVLAETQNEICISTFKPDFPSTEARLAYYRSCGLQNLEVIPQDEGVLITSSEGLHSMVFHPTVLKEKLAMAGFSLQGQYELGEIGELYHFTKAENVNETTSYPAEILPLTQQGPLICLRQTFADCLKLPEHELITQGLTRSDLQALSELLELTR